MPKHRPGFMLPSLSSAFSSVNHSVTAPMVAALAGLCGRMAVCSVNSGFNRDRVMAIGVFAETVALAINLRFGAGDMIFRAMRLRGAAH